jgi:hypothetical protein
VGAAQDLRVPDARRQRSVWRRMVRPLPGSRSLGGAGGLGGTQAPPSKPGLASGTPLSSAICPLASDTLPEDRGPGDRGPAPSRGLFLGDWEEATGQTGK